MRFLKFSTEIEFFRKILTEIEILNRNRNFSEITEIEIFKISKQNRIF